jgi:CPA2 family monovalent cation:H+ antiporter-2
MGSTLGLISTQMTAFVLAGASVTMALIPALSVVARHFSAQVARAHDVGLTLKAAPGQQHGHAIVVGHGRVGKVVTSFLKEHEVPHVATDSNPHLVAEDRQRGLEVFFGDATQTGFLRACGIMDAEALIVTTGSQSTADAIVLGARQVRPDILIVARARDTAHARHLYSIGVSDAVPETVEASLQISEAALVGLGVPMGFVIASVHEKRDKFRAELRRAAKSGEVEDDL